MAATGLAFPETNVLEWELENLKFLRLTSVDFCKALLILWKPRFYCLESKRAGFGNHSLPSGCILQSLSAVDASLLGALGPSGTHLSLL